MKFLTLFQRTTDLEKEARGVERLSGRRDKKIGLGRQGGENKKIRVSSNRSTEKKKKTNKKNRTKEKAGGTDTDEESNWDHRTKEEGRTSPDQTKATTGQKGASKEVI